LTEQGPFRPQADLTLAANPYSWNKVANYLFIEQPVGVGFSYSTDKSAYINVGDDEAAALNYQLIVAFLERFPQYGPNEFYISAESYGGHYMPTLAKYIVQTDVDKVINFKGLAVGNPYTDPIENVIGSIDTLYGHSLVPHPTYAKWVRLCRNGKGDNAACEALQLDMQYREMGNLNPYALSYPVCLADGADGKKRAALTPYQARIAYSVFPRATQEALGLPSDPEDYVPCLDDYATAYLNRPEVKTAIHANTAITWNQCSGKTPYGTLQYNYTWSSVPMEPYYQWLVESGANLKIMVFSGDDDSVCGTVGTQSWIYDLGYDVVPGTAWASWDYEGQVAGYVQKFEGYTFATVHGAGHEVPTYKPAQALKLISAYFNSSSWLF
jgi:carboxypeptidase C (cathepsin A)